MNAPLSDESVLALIEWPMTHSSDSGSKVWYCADDNCYLYGTTRGAIAGGRHDHACRIMLRNRCLSDLVALRRREQKVREYCLRIINSGERGLRTAVAECVVEVLDAPVDQERS